jgi:hypothetical protein
VVILPLVTQHYIMPQHTCFTPPCPPAQRMIVIVGNPKSVRIAVEADPTIDESYSQLPLTDYYGQ